MLLWFVAITYLNGSSPLLRGVNYSLLNHAVPELCIPLSRTIYRVAQSNVLWLYILYKVQVKTEIESSLSFSFHNWKISFRSSEGPYLFLGLDFVPIEDTGARLSLVHPSDANGLCICMSLLVFLFSCLVLVKYLARYRALQTLGRLNWGLTMAMFIFRSSHIPNSEY